MQKTMHGSYAIYMSGKLGHVGSRERGTTFNKSKKKNVYVIFQDYICTVTCDTCKCKVKISDSDDV